MYLVFWEEDFDKIEIEPYTLVCDKICVEGKLQMNRFSRLPFLVVREPSQILLREPGQNCKDKSTGK